MWYNMYMESQNIQAVLWDISEDNIKTLPIEFLLRRAFSYGSIPLMLSLRKKHGKDMFKKVFANMKKTSMSARRHLYIKEYLTS